MSSRTDTLAAWLAEHPAARRTLTLVLTVHTLALWSLVSAPSAAAATGAAALGWTGLTDTDGVPLGDYFLSIVDTSEAITNNGQGIDLLDPSSIPKWMVQATQVAMTHSLAASWLTTEAAGFVFIIGIALWFLRFALSSSWLVALAGLGRPLYNAVNNLITQMWLGPIAVTLCVTVGGLHMIRGRRGRGWAVIGSGALLTVLLLTVFRDPITDLYSDHGLLAIGRATGFQIAQAAAHNGSYAPGQSLDAQLDGLLAQLITAAARHPLQVLNYGMVVDNVGSCRGAWSAAIRAGGGDGDGPAHAMAACGAPQALAHAQHLDAGDTVLGGFFIVVAILLALFLWYVGITVLLVGLKALYFSILVGPAFLHGIAGFSRAAAFAKHCATQLFLHVVQMLVFTVYLGVSAVAMSWVLTVGGNTVAVVPRMLFLALYAVAAALLFRYIDRSFHTDGIGTIAAQLRAAAHSGGRAARRPYDDTRDAIERGRQLNSRFNDWRRGNTGTSEAEDADSAAEGGPSTPALDVVKPRPTRTPSHPPASTSAAKGEQAAEEAGGAARAGATAETAATLGVEGAATVAAPEVVIPAVVAAAAVHHATDHHKQQGTNGARAHSASVAGTEQRPPLGGARPRSENGDPRHGATPTQDLGHPALAARPATRAVPPTPSTAGDSRRDPSRDPTTSDPPLEFQSTPPPRTPTRSTPEGQ
jgi:hypothetical protein